MLQFIKDLFESKFKLLLNEKKLENPKAVFDYSHAIVHVYENVEDKN